MTRQVLVVEDHPELRDLVTLHLKDMDCQITEAASGSGGLSYAKNQSFDLIVLDWMLPDVTGIDICREMRLSGNNTPILMLTAKASETDRVMGLDAGADDYVTKPFSVPEFLARVRAIFRRNDATHLVADIKASQATLHIGALRIEDDQRQVYVGARRIELTSKEYDLLHFLSHHPGRVFTRQHLLDAVWGEGFEGFEHTVNSHINRLRAKIETDPAEPAYIMTVWGVGYKMADFQRH